MNEHRDDFENAIGDAFGIEVFSYNEKITEDFWYTLKAIAERGNCAYETANELRVSEDYIELMHYIICNNGNADYGTSPRCCWLTEKGKTVYTKLLKLRKILEENPDETPG